ncbi:hypothetical protein DSCO28_36840 [Desulfosarcina ovata subsp. sediminis]|uniref:Uncharacterized protein n=1 Tax=Desulfosarcina ovata subsp. sediminis TaxID=885957 RepID=A0A5K7ZSD6_9BACT|nr:hypothetical protein [Desulfosarcina ovata]BBO83118.1 hypothetical protein DSCO28_36840 [Desulfosarcina ovata subsp. sediminis]
MILLQKHENVASPLTSNLNADYRKRDIQYNCFKAAAEFIQQLQIKDFFGHHRLVHGNLASLNQDKPVNHAWLEELDFVYDISDGHKRLLLKKDYYLNDTITDVKKYTTRQALKLIKSSGNWGPWG